MSRDDHCVAAVCPSVIGTKLVRRLRIFVLKGEYAILRLREPAEVPLPPTTGFYSLTRSGDELSLICPVAEAPREHARTSVWACMRIEESFGLDEPGVLLSALRPLSEAGLSVFAVATFETDHLLVRAERLSEVQELLRAAGHTVVDDVRA